MALKILLGVALSALVVGLGTWEGSRGTTFSRAPTVVGLSSAKASDRVRHAHLVPRIEILRSRGASDIVVAQRPPAGARVRRGSKIALIVAEPGAWRARQYNP